MANPAGTNIPVGHAVARTVYGVALFHQAVRKGTFSKLMSGPLPSEGKSVQKASGKEQSSEDYPIVRVTDLSKQAGDKVTIDVFNIIKGKPIMGDKKITGRLMALSFSSTDCMINQVRGGADVGGKMSQQRTNWGLRKIAKGNLAGWYARFDDQSTQVHLAGARGTENTADWVVPLESDADFTEIMVNTIKPPTPNRHLYGGNATSIATIDASDILSLDTIDKTRAFIDELTFPMQPIKLPDDPGSEENPLFLLLVSPRQWYHLSTATGATAWRTFLAAARERSSKNPLFTGEAGMWNGILIRKILRPIRFAALTAVPAYTSQANANNAVVGTDSVAAGVTVDRALLLGAQALANVYGRHQSSDFYFSWFERKVSEDHDNSIEISMAAMNGKSKLTFVVDGDATDHGVIAIDSSAPNPNA